MGGYYYFLIFLTISLRAATVWATSSWVLCLPKVKRTADFARASPEVAVITCEGVTAPAEHAEPVETHIPFKSRQNRMFSPSQPSKEIFALDGTRCTGSPFKWVPSISVKTLFTNSSRSAAIFLLCSPLTAFSSAVASPTA